MIDELMATANIFQRKLGELGCLLMDGATGTNLFDKGLVSGNAPELWNDEYPDRILELNADFVKAGSDVILTNSFGANAMRLKLHKNEHRVSELNEKSALVARRAANLGNREVIVAGSMGPLGELMEPLGTLGMEEAIEAFTDQALALERGGCDILWIETLSSKEELIAATQGAERTSLPFTCTASFDTKGRTMMGISPAEFARICITLNVLPVAVGSNCGIGPAQTVAAVREMCNELPEQFNYVAKANCGVPYWEGAQIRYSASPQQMYDYAQVARNSGATVIGGCCGTQAEHVRRMREALDNYEPEEQLTVEQIETRLGEVFNTTPKTVSKKRSSNRTSKRRSRKRRAN